jgi:hypothetical protein
VSQKVFLELFQWCSEFCGNHNFFNLRKQPKLYHPACIYTPFLGVLPHNCFTLHHEDMDTGHLIPGLWRVEQFDLKSLVTLRRAGRKSPIAAQVM